MISGRKYFSAFAVEMARSFAEAGGAPEEQAGGEDLFAPFLHEYEEIEQEPGLHEPHPAFIHLGNARFYAAGRGAWHEFPEARWRGKLSAVEGFFLGEMAASQPGKKG